MSETVELTEIEQKSLNEIPHPSLPEGTSIYGDTKVFPDYKAEDGETYFTLVHGLAHESSVSFIAVLQATRALRKGFETAIYFYGPGSLNCLATRGFPTVGNSAFPGEHNINNQLKTFIAEGGKVFCCRFGLSLHGAREEDLIEGVIPTHPRRPGRADPLRPQGRHHQLDLPAVRGYAVSVGTDTTSTAVDVRIMTRAELALHGVALTRPCGGRTARGPATTDTSSSTVPTPRCPATPTAPTPYGTARCGWERRLGHSKTPA